MNDEIKNVNAGRDWLMMMMMTMMISEEQSKLCTCYLT